MIMELELRQGNYYKPWHDRRARHGDDDDVPQHMQEDITRPFESKVTERVRVEAREYSSRNFGPRRSRRGGRKAAGPKLREHEQVPKSGCSLLLNLNYKKRGYKIKN